MKVEINLTLKPEEGDNLVFYNLTDIDLEKPVVIILDEHGANIYQGRELTADSGEKGLTVTNG